MHCFTSHLKRTKNTITKNWNNFGGVFVLKFKGFFSEFPFFPKSSLYSNRTQIEYMCMYEKMVRTYEEKNTSSTNIRHSNIGYFFLHWQYFLATLWLEGYLENSLEGLKKLGTRFLLRRKNCHRHLCIIYVIKPKERNFPALSEKRFCSWLLASSRRWRLDDTLLSFSFLHNRRKNRREK